MISHDGAAASSQLFVAPKCQPASVESGSANSSNEELKSQQKMSRPSLAPTALDNENALTRTQTHTHLRGLIRARARDDDDPTDWWFASTAIPLLSATFAPMANMLSIAALVVYWRNKVYDDDPVLKYSTSKGMRDPQWCLNLNGASLACGFVGNIFLLCNFTQKIRYIIALPVTVALFYMASGILIGITVGIDVYDPPQVGYVYSQGYWHAVIAAILYMLNAMLLMVNMLGYLLGHYPQHFDLNDEQRNLILQTMIFFVWLAGGAAVFAKIEAWEYVDALYFCDVTLLTIGFGDFVAISNSGRGIILPYTVGGTIILGLLVSSIHKFAQELSKEKVVKKHIESRRVNTLSRAVSFQEPTLPVHLQSKSPEELHISRPLEADQIQQDLDEKAKYDKATTRTINFSSPPDRPSENSNDDVFVPKPLRRTKTLERVVSLRHLIPTRTQKQIIMRDEKDRFNKMRDIQHAARRFKKWYALIMSFVSFGLLWCVGAVVFWLAEAETQQLSYFQALYFCYVSLLTIGYGDLSPKSNAGKPFFVLWSLIAVPTMTILISDLGDTAIGGFKRKVLEYGGLAFLGKGRGWGLDWFMRQKQVQTIQRRLSAVGVHHDHPFSHHTSRQHTSSHQTSDPIDGSVIEDGCELVPRVRTIDELAAQEVSETQMIQELAASIQSVAEDMKHTSGKRYSYEEWVEFTRLIRFSRLDRDDMLRRGSDAGKQLEYDEARDGLIEWDWLDENSPMTSEQSEAEWVMDRLIESLVRSLRRPEMFLTVAKDIKETGGERKWEHDFRKMNLGVRKRHRHVNHGKRSSMSGKRGKVKQTGSEMGIG